MSLFATVNGLKPRTLGQLKNVYMAVNEPAARLALEDFGQYWQGKYDVIVKMWEKDWDELMATMDLGPTLRKITYTTNAIENLNREIRRVTKTKGAWVSDRALLIQLFWPWIEARKAGTKKYITGPVYDENSLKNLENDFLTILINDTLF